MKANELMIGDWVHYWILNINAKVNDIMSTGRLGIRFIDSKGKEGYIHGIMQESVKPIPITAEILEKNFNGADPYGIYFFGDDYIEVYIKEYTDGLWRVEVDEIEMSGLPTWKMYVSNVHELQHALRLCNIDKEIEL